MIATQFNVVALAPQVETVYQTVYETVYDNEPTTVMETRYRMAYRTEELHRHEAGDRDRRTSSVLTRSRNRSTRRSTRSGATPS